MKLLVIGGCGELGWEVVLAANSAPSVSGCVATYNRTEPNSAERAAVPGVEWVKLDCGDHSASRELVESSDVGAIIYCAVPKHGGAGGKGGDSIRRGIVDDVVNVATCKSNSTRLIVLGTDLVYDGLIPAGCRYKEDDPVTPTNFYAKSKAEMENELRGLPNVMVARTSLILTMGSATSVRKEHGKGVAFVIDALRGDLPGQNGAFDMFTDEKRNMSFSDDLATALIALVSPSASPISSTIHLAADEVCSRYDLACRLADYLDLPHALGTTVRPALSAESGLNRPLNCSLDTSRLQSVLQPVGVRIRGLSERLPSQNKT